MKYLLLLAIALVTAGVATAQVQWNGNAYRRIPEEERVLYSLGLFDGVTLATAFVRVGGEDAAALLYDSCFRGRTRGQMVAMINKHLDDYPDLWHEPMVSILIKAFSGSCMKQP